MDITASDIGHGQPYLLLHGGGGPMTVAGFATLLAEHGRVVTPTHPGFGGTDRPASMDSPKGLAARYVELLEELNLTDVCVVGNSLGGWVAAEIAVLRSPRVCAVVLVDAVGIDVPAHPVPDFFSLTPAEVAQRSWFDPSKMVEPTTLPPAAQAALPGNRAALAVYGRTMLDSTLLGRLSVVAVPALVVWGEADRIGDIDYGRAFAAAIPGRALRAAPPRRPPAPDRDPRGTPRPRPELRRAARRSSNRGLTPRTNCRAPKSTRRHSRSRATHDHPELTINLYRRT